MNISSTVINTRDANINVQLPSGRVITVNMLRMLVQTQNAEFKVKTGMFLPGLNRLHPTIRGLREEYELPYELCHTWADAAKMMRGMYTDIQEAINS